LPPTSDPLTSVAAISSARVTKESSLIIAKWGSEEG
jgi:hypothetical protein